MAGTSWSAPEPDGALIGVRARRGCPSRAHPRPPTAPPPPTPSPYPTPPPPDAAAIHDLVVRSGDAWTEALENVGRFCDTGNALYKIPAGLKFWEAALLLQDAGDRFWALVVAQGVEDWVSR